MLQIVTKIYFREGVPLHSSVHREVLFTNRTFLRGGSVVSLPVGELAPSTGIDPVSTATVSVTEHLEAEYPDGVPSNHVSTGGTELIAQLADVLSFGLNAVFSRDGDLVRKLVPNARGESSRSEASKLFRLTFDPARYVDDEELDGLRGFMAKLVTLRRDRFEAAMRAIRRSVRATQRAVTDPTVAYVDLVAAIESLADGMEAPTPTWDRLDDRKRCLFDHALKGVDAAAAERIRQAEMEAERLGAKGRFSAFVADNVSPEFFRTEAVDAERPIRGADFERAVKLAYDIRSRNVHILKDLPPEVLVIGGRADTVSLPDRGVIFSLEGLARLARHVIRAYVDGAEVGVDAEFDWRASLPGQIQMQLAPQYWVWMADRFRHESVERYFSGFMEALIAALAGRSESIPDMGAVLQRIEEMAPGTADGLVKQLMVAVYALWHRHVSPGNHRPCSAEFFAEHGDLLNRPVLPSCVVGLVSGGVPDWSDDQWSALAIDRRTERSKRQHLELPPSVDAALQAAAAMRLREAGRSEEAQALARFAVEELPGHQPLIAWEAALATEEEAARLDLLSLVLQVEPDAEPQKKATAGPG